MSMSSWSVVGRGPFRRRLRPVELGEGHQIEEFLANGIAPSGKVLEGHLWIEFQFWFQVFEVGVNEACTADVSFILPVCGNGESWSIGRAGGLGGG